MPVEDFQATVTIGQRQNSTHLAASRQTLSVEQSEQLPQINLAYFQRKGLFGGWPRQAECFTMQAATEQLDSQRMHGEHPGRQGQIDV